MNLQTTVPIQTRVYGQGDTTKWVNRDALNAAKMATFDRVPTTQAAKDWIEAVIGETLAYEAENDPLQRTRQERYMVAFSEACGAFALDLIRHSGNEASAGFMYRRFDRTMLSLTLVSATYFADLGKYWMGIGWLERTSHINTQQDFDGTVIDGDFNRTRRYRATPALLAHAQRFGITDQNVTSHSERSIKHAELVQVRNKKGGPIGYNTKGKAVRIKGPKFDQCRAQIERLNEFMQQHTYSLDEPPMVRRLFNCANRDGFDLDLGGRLYTMSEDNWMEIPKEERAGILIDGQETVEIDVRASHLTILYAMHGQEMHPTDDPYTIGNGFEPRMLVKGLVTASMGLGKMPGRWPKGLVSDYMEELGCRPNKDHKLKDVVEKLAAKHPVLKNLEADKLDWANLQYEESECFLGAMLELHETYEVLSLPVHDSLIVKRADAALARDVLKNAYQKRLGIIPHLR